MTATVLPFAATAAGLARQQLAADLHSYGVSGSFLEDAVVVVSELVGNAVLHARPLAAGGLRASWDCLPDRVVVAVTDGGSDTIPRARTADPGAPGGRGLGIVEALAAPIEIHAGPNETTVSTVVSVRPRSVSPHPVGAA